MKKSNKPNNQEDISMANEEKKNIKENTIIAVNSGNDENGTIQVTNNVIAAIIKKYVMSIDGVVRTAPQSLADGLASMLSRRSYESSIGLELTDEGAIVTLALVLRFGVSVPEVSKAVQDILFEKIPALSGYQVAKVNVNVVDLEEENETDEEDATISAEN